ncbi:unnamed protein product, partial [Rotaria socialis]
FFEKKVSPGRSVELFIAELNVILQKLHDTSITSTHRQKKQKHKLFLSDNPLATTQSSQSQNINSSSSFRNGKKKNYRRLVKRLKHKIRTRQHYQKKSNEYMEKTEAYQCLGVNDPLPNLIERTNKYLLDLRLAHWITQKQYELLCVKPSLKTTTTSGFEVMKQVYEWSTTNLRKETLLCTIDVVDLYTMIPQTEGVLAIKKCQYYHQIRGGAMGSPFTLTIANCYMFFLERNIVKQITNAGGLYLRYIDDMFIIINWPERHLNKQIDQWNTLDSNIQLKAQAGQSINFLDIYIENINADLFTKVYHKPSHEPYYLPFNSVHPLHMKKNIPFAMFLRAIRYCSTFKAFLDEREDLRMALLLNKYPGKFIDSQFNRVLKKCNITQSLNKEEKLPTDHYRAMFIHFSYCLNIRTLPTKSHTLWNEYFSESPINEIIPVIGTQNVQNLQKQLVENK